MAATITHPGRLGEVILALHNVREGIEINDGLRFRGSRGVATDYGKESGPIENIIVSLREVVAKRESGGEQLSDETIMRNAVTEACAMSKHMSQSGLNLLGLNTVDYSRALLLLDTIIGYWDRIRYGDPFLFSKSGARISELFESTRTMLVKEAERLDPRAIPSTPRKS